MYKTECLYHFKDPQETILYLIPAEENALTIVDSFHEGIRHKLMAFASQMGRKLLGVSDHVIHVIIIDNILGVQTKYVRRK